MTLCQVTYWSDIDAIIGYVSILTISRSAQISRTWKTYPELIRLAVSSGKWV